MGEGKALGNLGSAYAQLGDARRAIGYHEQDLAIARETGNAFGLAIGLFNLGLAQARQGKLPQALSSAQEAADLFTPLGHTEYAQRAQQLADGLQGGVAIGRGPGGNS